MNIQKIRYKNAFSVEFDLEPAIDSCCTVKLILQPILENAINYGVAGMEDAGEIRVTGRLSEGTVILTVSDNGMGMTREMADSLLTDNSKKQGYGPDSGAAEEGMAGGGPEGGIADSGAAEGTAGGGPEEGMAGSGRKRQHGSGVGLVNVNKRIQILFGKEYGLKVVSELDEGTEVSIRIPAVAFTEENRKILEKGYLLGREELRHEG